MQKFREIIGARLKAERERLDLSQLAFAEIGDVSKRTQIDWEQGKASPNADALALWAEYGIDVLYVLTGTRTPAPADSLTPEERALLDNYQHADDDGKAAARRVLDALAQSDKERKKRA